MHTPPLRGGGAWSRALPQGRIYCAHTTFKGRGGERPLVPSLNLLPQGRIYCAHPTFRGGGGDPWSRALTYYLKAVFIVHTPPLRGGGAWSRALPQGRIYCAHPTFKERGPWSRALPQGRIYCAHPTFKGRGALGPKPYLKAVFIVHTPPLRRGGPWSRALTSHYLKAYLLYIYIVLYLLCTLHCYHSSFMLSHI